MNAEMTRTKGTKKIRGREEAILIGNLLSLSERLRPLFPRTDATIY